MKILFKDLLNKTMDLVRKYANDELVRKIINGSQSDLVFTISITGNSINISTWVEDCLRVKSHRIDSMHIYNSTSSMHCYIKDLVTIWVSPNWEFVSLYGFYNIMFSNKDIDYIFTDDDIREILEKDPFMKFIEFFERSVEYMNEDGVIDTDVLDTF